VTKLEINPKAIKRKSATRNEEIVWKVNQEQLCDCGHILESSPCYAESRVSLCLNSPDDYVLQ
jgi:hypothetical protein